MRIQNKIASIFTILTGGIILSLSAFLYIFASESTSASFSHRLEVRSDLVGHAALLDSGAKTSIYNDIKEKHLGDLPFEKHYLVRQSDERKLARVKRQLPLPDSFYEEIEERKVARFHKKDTTYVGLKISEAKTGKELIIISSAYDLYGLEEVQHLKMLLAIGFLISMLFVFTFGKLFARQMFYPIRRIIRNVTGISAHNLHHRLVVETNGKDEIADLTNTFNDMLNRLEIAFEMQNNFVSNASHEFKTPLTIISGEAQLGLSQAGVSPEIEDSFRTIFQQTEKLELLTNSMLRLAQTGFDGKKVDWDEMRIDELIISVKGTVDQMLPSNNVQINFDALPENEEKLIVNGNKALLTSAIANIMLNSCKYSDNKPVTVVVKSDSVNVIVEITDQGIGIPDREIAQIYVPFFRASNTDNYKGYGIGLPLANNIIKMHHGSIIVSSKVGEGTSFTINLPVKYR